MLRQDLRFAFRTLRRQLPVTLFAAASLSLAIAGNTTVFSTVNGLIYRPLPYAEPHRLAVVGERSGESRRGHSFGPTSLANFLDLRERQTSFQALAAFRPTTVNLGRVDAAAEPLSAAAVTPELFPVLGVRTVAGRTFLPAEGVPGRHRVAVVSSRLWRERFAAEEAVGATLVLDGEPHDVIGLLPDDFEFLDPAIELYVPLAPERGGLDRHARDVIGVGRLAPRVRDAAAQAEMTAIMAQLVEEHPGVNRGYEIDVLNVRHELPLSRTRRTFFLFQLALVFVLLIACANVANLLLARAQAREREFAIRSSLGAGRGRIARQVLTEQLLLAFLAGGLGLLLGRLGVAFMGRAMEGRFPRAYAPVVDGRVIGFTVLVTLLTGLAFGLAPVARTFRVDLVSALRQGAPGIAAGGRRRRLVGNALVVGEIALALVLLGGAGILLKSFQALQSSDPGFDTVDLLTVQLALPEARYPGDEEIVAAVEQLVEGLSGLPGVAAATASNHLPRSPFTFPATYTLDGRAPGSGEPPPRALWLAADSRYFATLGVPLLRGRAFTAADRGGSPPVAVINEALAKLHWGSSSPLGERLSIQGRWRTIVGVVATVRHGLAISDRPEPAIYLPWAQLAPRQVSLVLRTERQAASLTEEVRRRVLSIDPGLAISRLDTQDAVIAQHLAASRIYSTILAGFGALALALAALGTYGVLAHAVARRTHEIGVRMALGAGRGRVLRMVVRHALALAALGVAIGAPASVWTARILSGLLASLTPIAVSSVIGSALVLVLAALLASWLPARRAAGLDLVQALRYE